MPAHPSKVNLVPPSEFESGFWGKFLKWAVTTGRYMIILTEMVVIIAFLMRFKLDEDMRNLNEQINGQVAFLQSQSNQEIQFKRLQKKIVLANKMLMQRSEPTLMLDYLEARLQPEIVVKRRNITPYDITLTATTLSDRAMGQLMSTISADGVWKSLDVTELIGNKVNGIKFTISAKK
jgi:hypothetical protein